MTELCQQEEKFTKEFKLMRVELRNALSDLSALIRKLDISPALLYRWRKAYSKKQGNSFPGNGNVIWSETEQELARLK